MRQGAGITQRREVLMTEQVYSASACLLYTSDAADE